MTGKLKIIYGYFELCDWRKKSEAYIADVIEPAIEELGREYGERGWSFTGISGMKDLRDYLQHKIKSDFDDALERMYGEYLEAVKVHEKYKAEMKAERDAAAGEAYDEMLLRDPEELNDGELNDDYQDMYCDSKEVD